MFESKGEISVAIEALWQLSLGLNRGDVLTHEAVESATGMNREHVSYWHITKKFRKRLLKEREIACISVPGVGFRLLTHRDQVRDCGRNRHKRMFRQSQMGIREISAVDPSTLSLHDRKLRMAQLDRLFAERKSARKGMNESTEVRKTEVNPRRPLPPNVSDVKPSEGV